MGEAFKEILLCVSGLTPQVITETLYVLAIAPAGSGCGLPQAMHVVTTAVGLRRIRETLLHPVDGQLARLRRDYDLDGRLPDLPEDHIHLVRDASGAPVDDIRDEADNVAAADLITAQVAAFTHDPDTRLHVSLAGGRKTMGFYAGHALSLYGRQQDSLSHVLVNAPFEFHPDFFYPPPQPRWLTTPGRGEAVSTADARVTLAPIPVVRLRDGLGPALLDGRLTFKEAVERAQQALQPARLTIDLGERDVWLQGVACPLSATHFLWLTWFADRARRGCGPVAFDEAGAADLLRVVDWLEGAGPNPLRTSIEEALVDIRREGRSNYFERTRSKLNAALADKSGLAPPVVERYQIQASGAHGHTAYTLALQAGQINLQGEP